MTEKIKVHLVNDRNGVLTDLYKRTDELELMSDYRDADAIVTWQDVREGYKELALVNNSYMKKPFIVVQHGRACTRDYGPPENFVLRATKFCCWGQDDYEVMKGLGYGDRTVITGCPFLNKVRQKTPHVGKNVLFVPVVTDHEEPNNIIAYWELKKLELSHSQEVIKKHRRELINGWNTWRLNPDEKKPAITIPYSEINKNWRLMAKLIPIHDKALYFGSTTTTNPGTVTHTEECVKILANTDVVVCVEEGTLQTLAMAMDIPIVVVKGFELLNYGGLDYSKERKAVHTKGAEWVELSELDNAIQRELANPERLAKEREEVVAREFGDGSSDPTDNIIKEIRESITNG